MQCICLWKFSALLSPLSPAPPTLHPYQHQHPLQYANHLPRTFLTKTGPRRAFVLLLSLDSDKVEFSARTRGDGAPRLPGASHPTFCESPTVSPPLPMHSRAYQRPGDPLGADMLRSPTVQPRGVLPAEPAVHSTAPHHHLSPTPLPSATSLRTRRSTGRPGTGRTAPPRA